MPERVDAYAYFWVSGYSDAAEIVSARLQLEPTSVQRIGDVLTHGPRARVNRWVLMSPLPRGEHPHQEYLDALLTLLEPQASAIRALATQHQAGINCVGYYHGANPGLHLSAVLLARLSALGVPVDFDLYNFGEDDEGGSPP